MNFFTYYKYQHALFFRLDDNTYSDSIFGAPAGNPAFEDILSTYCDSWDKKKSYVSLAERIKIILTAKYDVPLQNTGMGFRYPVSIISPNIGLADINWEKAICEHDFSDHACEEDYVTLKHSELISLCKVYALDNAKTNQVDIVQRELNDIKSSTSWKIVMKIRNLGDSPCGPLLKKIFYSMLNIRNKFKKRSK